MIKAQINVEFPLGAIVHLKCEDQNACRMVTDYQVNSQGVKYGLSFVGGNSWHYAHELAVTDSMPRQFGFTSYQSQGSAPEPITIQQAMNAAQEINGN